MARMKNHAVDMHGKQNQQETHLSLGQPLKMESLGLYCKASSLQVYLYKSIGNKYPLPLFSGGTREAGGSRLYTEGIKKNKPRLKVAGFKNFFYYVLPQAPYTWYTLYHQVVSNHRRNTDASAASIKSNQTGLFRTDKTRLCSRAKEIRVIQDCAPFNNPRTRIYNSRHRVGIAPNAP